MIKHRLRSRRLPQEGESSRYACLRVPLYAAAMRDKAQTQASLSVLKTSIQALGSLFDIKA